MGIGEILSTLPDNPYFGAGFGLVGIGAGLALLRKATVVGSQVARRLLTITLEVQSQDRSYLWLLQWITARASKTAQHLSVETTYSEVPETGRVLTQFAYVPSPGVHFFKYKSNWFRAERTRETQRGAAAPWESVTLTTFGNYRMRRVFDEMLDEARRMALDRQEGTTPIYVALGSEWRLFGCPRRKRPIDSVVLDDGISERIQGDVGEFLESPNWYGQRGIPYRRGYLLHGPPGCGKSSFVQALAGSLDYGICTLNLGDRSLIDDRLNHLLNIAPEQSIILLEDIDAVFGRRDVHGDVGSARQQAMYDGMPPLTFSGLLNALDGVASAQARILVMTTNYVERLDPALIRPGRVDVKQYIGRASAHQIRCMFIKFYPDEAARTAHEFSEAVAEHGRAVSLAQLQAFFMQYKTYSSSVIADAARLWQDDIGETPAVFVERKAAIDAEAAG